MKLSVVTTLYRSAAFIEEFHRRASAEAKKITDDYEIVMVDDGSPDDSLQVALALVRQDPRLRIVELSRNFGHHKAMMAGMEAARGDMVFLIDADLEEPPELLGEFRRELEAGTWDVVYGYQKERKGGLVERYVGRIAWKLINRLYSIRIPRNQCTVRLMRSDYVKALLLHKEHDTIIGGLWVITGFKQKGVPIKKLSRVGTTYGFSTRLGILLNGVTSFSAAPLQLMSLFGLLVTLTSFVFGLVIIVQKLTHNAAIGWSSVMVSIWFLSGTIIFCLGVIGLYISRIFIETKNRPYVIVSRVHTSERP